MVEIVHSSGIWTPNNEFVDNPDTSFRLFTIVEPRDSNTTDSSNRRINRINGNLSKGLHIDDDLRLAIGKFMNKTVVENIILAMIMINSILIGVGTYDVISEDEHAQTIFNLLDLVFLIIFTVELGLTIFYQRLSSFTDMWVMFDFLSITLSWIFSGGENQSVQVIRSLRVFRILPRIESLKAVMTALCRSLKKLGILGLFTIMIMFIFAIYFTESYGEMYENGQRETDYFSRLDLTYFTLLQLLTLDDWTIVLRDVQTVHPYAWIPILIYVILTAFILVNLGIAIICEYIFMMNSTEDKVESMKSEMKDLERKLYSTRSHIIDHLELSKSQRARGPLVYASKLDNPQAQAGLNIGLKESTGDPLPHTHETEGGDSAPDSSFCSSLCKPADPIYEPKRILCGKIINNEYVQGTLVFLIIVNSIVMAVGTFSFVKQDPSVHSVFETLNTMFLIIYTIENSMQLIYHRLGMFKCRWLTFDFILIVSCWLIASLSPAFRVFRLIHVFPKFKRTRAITETLVAALSKIGAITAITLLLFYVFGVMFTTLFKDIPVGGENGLSIDFFSRLDYTFLTLFQIMTMAEWAPLTRELETYKFEYQFIAPILTSVFLTISGLLFVNAIVALICQAQEHARDKEKTTSRGKNGFIKSFDDRVLDMKEMHSEIMGLLKQSDTDTDEDKRADCQHISRRV